MRSLYLVLSILMLSVLGCAGDAGGSDGGVGTIQLPLTTSSASHDYHLGGDAELRDAEGALVEYLNLQGAQASMSVEALEPGSYTLSLSSVALAKDNVPMAAGTFTMTSPNPLLIVVEAGETTAAVIAFNVAGDPVEFVCTEETCGDVVVTVQVTEVPPSE